MFLDCIYKIYMYTLTGILYRVASLSFCLDGQKGPNSLKVRMYGAKEENYMYKPAKYIIPLLCVYVCVI